LGYPVQIQIIKMSTINKLTSESAKPSPPDRSAYGKDYPLYLTHFELWRKTVNRVEESISIDSLARTISSVSGTPLSQVKKGIKTKAQAKSVLRKETLKAAAHSAVAKKQKSRSAEQKAKRNAKNRGRKARKALRALEVKADLAQRLKSAVAKVNSVKHLPSYASVVARSTPIVAARKIDSDFYHKLSEANMIELVSPPLPKWEVFINIAEATRKRNWGRAVDQHTKMFYP
jgi:hypothetical protein